ncbi:uncharacterized protein Dana_GF27271, isoform A [Drosophila ananassae]|uniref:Uncharacterized protein, isoform A n=1 Tax=Drosophila ananassae TaxID=7217 RepID=A0A0P9BWX2_DROAN|nr:uncharacterized protein LOC26514680 [Drosophila ananassae]XP_044571694.1 uncharacterized protein LOC26514680 [Drosophila ananassae]KPU76011.1 uncharacterized protein Dana_GF27271, isoform A [Drosophila ananassae]
MVTFGGVAKVLKGFQNGASIWVKTVNPGWYEARVLPRTMLREKKPKRVVESNKEVRPVRQPPKTAMALQKSVTTQYPFIDWD